jgi:hypothetical protein
MSDLEIRLLRRLIREEIGHNFSTRNNDPIQYYETAPVDVSIYPVDTGFYVEIKVPQDESLSTYTHSFKTKDEAEIFARKYVDFVKKTLDQKDPAY